MDTQIKIHTVLDNSDVESSSYRSFHFSSEEAERVKQNLKKRDMCLRVAEKSFLVKSPPTSVFVVTQSNESDEEFHGKDEVDFFSTREEAYAFQEEIANGIIAQNSHWTDQLSWIREGDCYNNGFYYLEIKEVPIKA